MKPVACPRKADFFPGVQFPRALSVASQQTSYTPSFAMTAKSVNTPLESFNSREEGIAVDRVDVRDGRLTMEQWKGVEKWMTRAKQSLGLKVWECLGSGGGFCRARNRIREAILSGDYDQVPDWHSTSLPRVHANGGAIPPESPKAAGVGKWGEGEVILYAWNSERSRANAEESWEDNLSQVAALVIEATLWTIATEPDRSITCAAITRDRELKHGRPTCFIQGEGRKGNDKRGWNNLTEPAEPLIELGISLPRARRFIRGCRLIDRVHVLDVDMDLAFQRWEEESRAGGGMVAAVAGPTCLAGQRNRGSHGGGGGGQK